jgi:hypothetical protein
MEKDIFCWENYHVWTNDVLELLADIIDEQVIQEIKQNPPEYLSADREDWLISPVWTTKQVNICSIKHLLADRLAKKYHSIKAYHGCSPTDISSYYKKGLLTLNVNNHRQAIRKHFSSGKYPEISKEIVEQAIKQTDIETRDGWVYLALDDRMLIKYCGHYLLYGSEYAIAIAAELSRIIGYDYRWTLKGIGKPTIFICHIPLEMISANTMNELAGCLLVGVFNKILFKKENPELIDFSFMLKNSLPSNCIVDHYHPKNITDWL